MTGRAARYGGVLIAAYAVFLLALFPAARGVALLEERRLLPFALYQVSGTIWNGRAAATAGRIQLQTLAWEIRPLAALAGRLEIAVSVTHGAGNVTARLGRRLNGALYVRDLAAALPLAELAVLALGQPAGLSGEIVVQLTELEIQDRRITRAAGVVTATDAGIGPPVNAALGSFALTLETTAEGIKGNLRDTGGPLEAQGLLLLREDNSYRLTAVFAARDPERGDLRQVLGWIGAPGANGKVSLTYNGTLTLDQYLAPL